MLNDGGLRSAGHQVGGHRHLALAADAIDRRGSGAGHDAHHLIQTDGAQLGGGHGHLGEAFGAAAELFLGAHDHVVLIVAGIEGGGLLSGHQGIERHLDIHHADAEIGGARAVDFQADFRLAGAQRGVGIHQCGVGPHFGEQRLGIGGELLQVGTLDEVLDFGVALIAADRADQFDAGVDLRGILLHQLAGALHELLLRDGALIDIGQLDVDGGVVDALIGAAARRHQRVRHAGQAADLLCDALGQSWWWRRAKCLRECGSERCTATGRPAAGSSCRRT